MKRIFTAYLAAVMVFLLSGCAAPTVQPRPAAPTTTTTSTTTTTTATTTTTTTTTRLTTTTKKQVIATTTQGYRDRVYVTPYGRKYHRRASCAGENATPTERETAALYYAPCKKCAGG